MKKLFKTTVAALAVSSAMFAGAASAQQKIGVVDMMQVFQQLPQREQISQQLQTEFQDRFEEMRQLEQKIQELRQKQERDASVMSADEKTQLNRELEQLVAEAQLKSKALQEDTRRRQAEERDVRQASGAGGRPGGGCGDHRRDQQVGLRASDAGQL